MGNLSLWEADPGAGVGVVAALAVNGVSAGTRNAHPPWTNSSRL